MKAPAGELTQNVLACFLQDGQLRTRHSTVAACLLHLALASAALITLSNACLAAGHVDLRGPRRLLPPSGERIW